MTWRRETSSLFLAGFATLLAVAGCSDDGRPPRYPVTGTLKSADGESLAHVSVMFRSIEQDLTARGRVLPDGTFALTTFEKNDGAVAGRHRVQVMPFRNPDGSLGGPIHPRFLQFRTSELEFEVAADGDNHFEITVEMR